MKRLKIIGVEEHSWIPEIRDALNALPDDRKDPSLGAFNSGEVDQKLSDYGEGRIRDMDKMGMDFAVLSITTPATQILDAPDAVRLSRKANNRLAEAVKANPKRFAAFATLPTPDPQAAVEELRRAVQELGFKGAMIHGRTGEKMLDHPDFAPILDEAAALDVPIFIHPQVPSKAVRDAYYEGLPGNLGFALSAGMWGWHMETAINALRLILSGTFERTPGLQIILGHWGEMLPFYLERIEYSMGLTKALPKSFSQYFRDHFYIAPSGLWSWQMLTHALTEIGAERILFAIDYPFQSPLDGSSRKWLEDAPINLSDKEKIGHLNAEKLFKL